MCWGYGRMETIPTPYLFRMYKKLRYGLFGRVMTLQNPAGRKFAEICYKIAQKTFGFN